MRLKPAQAAQLVRLSAGESIRKSQLPKALLHPLQQAGVVRLEKSGAGYLVRGIPGRVASFVEHHWGVRDVNRFAESTPDNRSRESMADIAGDSKALPNRPLEGIFLRSTGQCYLRDQTLAVTPPGSAIFLSPGELPHLHIQTPLLIGVENPACFLRFEKCYPYFSGLSGMPYSLALRWCWSLPWQQWLRKWQGVCLYFPDYDPAGLRIFATEVLTHQPTARLLLPIGLESLLLERGSRDLFLKQEHLLQNLPDHPDISVVVEILLRTRKALEQEVLL